MVRKTMARVVSLSVCLGMCLSTVGCGRTKVQYEGGRKAQSTGQPEDKQDGSASQETGDVTQYPLAKKLGVTSGKYEDSVDAVSAAQFVRADITLPAVSEMGTVSVQENYLNKADKKRLCDYFFETGTTEVNTAMVSSKERIGDELRKMDEEDFGDYDKDMQAQLKQEYARKKKMYAKAPRMADISKDPGNYRQNAYLGKVGDTYATLTVDSNPARRTSSFEMKVLDGSGYMNAENKPGKSVVNAGKVTINGHEIDTYTQWQYIGNDSFYLDETEEAQADDRTNECSMSREDASKKAEQICRDLGFEEMGVAYVSDLHFNTWSGSGVDSYEKNGYAVTLTRQVQGLAVDKNIWSSSQLTCLSDYEHGGNYPEEYIQVVLNDHGTLYVYGQGMMSSKAQKKVQSMMGFEQIRDVLRKELAKVDQDRARSPEWTRLHLEYLRIRENRDRSYLYLPVWILSTGSDEYVMGSRQYAVEYSICINALDGSPVDLSKQELTENLDSAYDMFVDDAYEQLCQTKK